jgi:hypothetical protein
MKRSGTAANVDDCHDEEGHSYLADPPSSTDWLTWKAIIVEAIKW